MVRAEIAPDEAEDAGGLDARQGRQRSMAPFLPEQIKGFYGSSVLRRCKQRERKSVFPPRSGAQCAPRLLPWRVGKRGQGDVTRSVGQNEDGIPAPAGHAEATDERTFLSAAGDVFQKSPVCQQICHKVFVVYPAQADRRDDLILIFD